MGDSPALRFLNAIGRQRTIEDLNGAIKELVTEYRYSSGDLTDAIAEALDLTADELGMMDAYITTNVEFYGDENGVKFPWEIDD